jgi:RNA-directed DNA polymerase
MGLIGFIKRLFGGGSPKPQTNQPRHNRVPEVSPTRSAPQATPGASPKVSKGLSPLDTGLFDAKNREQTQAAVKAAGGSLRQNLWAFGRQSVIPPVTDPRTLIIDRAMVGEGLITAEQLKQIHEVGEQWEELRPSWHFTFHQGERAVQADKAAKAELKRQKKEEAAERRKQRAEGIAQRRATDILFLGRGVSGGLADRRSHLEKLQEAKLPVLATPADIAKALELPIQRLRWLAFHAEVTPVTHYVRFSVPKKSGGTRELAAPHADMAKAQRWILQNILALVPLVGVAHGFVPGRSTLTNARSHIGKDVVINADLKDFFPSITFPRVKGIFQHLGYSPAVSTILALLCTESPRCAVTYDGQLFHVATGPRALPQGACTSPALSNICARSMDHRFVALATTHGWTYTRYADDLTLSAKGDAANKTGLLLSRLHDIVEDEHFIVNAAKTRIQRRNSQQSVTGVVVNDGAAAPRKLRKRMRAILHQAQKTGLALQNRHGHDHFEGYVQGMISYISMLNPKQGEALKRDLRKLGQSSLS